MNDLWGAALAGIAAGLAVAMPLGAIAALLLREGVVNGFRVSAAGASGVALVDTIYCAAAVSVGSLVAPAIEDRRALFLVLSGLLIAVIGVRQLVSAVRARHAEEPEVTHRSAARSFSTFVGLTAVNPVTLVYFVALGGAISSLSTSSAAPVVFTVAVGLSSWAWQLGLAALGSFIGRSLSPRVSEIIGVIASIVIIGLGLAVAAAGAT